MVILIDEGARTQNVKRKIDEGQPGSDARYIEKDGEHGPLRNQGNRCWA